MVKGKGRVWLLLWLQDYIYHELLFFFFVFLVLRVFCAVERRNEVICLAKIILEKKQVAYNNRFQNDWVN